MAVAGSFQGKGGSSTRNLVSSTKNMVVPYSNVVPEIFPELIPLSQLNHVHPLMRKLFPEKELENIPLAGRLRFFLTQRLTNDPEILSWVSGLMVELTALPVQQKLPHQANMSREEKDLVQKEVEAMLAKGAIQRTQSQKGQFLSNIFLVAKKQGGNRPVINLKHLNAYIPYQHFKMEGLGLLKDMLKEKDYMVKIDLRDAYFCVPLHPSQRKFIRFRWEGKLNEFL